VQAVGRRLIGGLLGGIRSSAAAHMARRAGILAGRE